MNIVVLGGSPKGAKSVTMQYVNYLKANAVEHSFNEYYIASTIRSIEKDKNSLQTIIGEIQKADAILWAFPLYYGLVHSAYKRFIELVFENNMEKSFNGKHCAILATSIRFFDHTAIEYIRGISEDMGMRVDEVYSAHMNDLIEGDGAKQCNLFFNEWMRKIDSNDNAARLSAPISFEPHRLVLDENRKFMPHSDTRLGLVTESGVSENLDSMVNAMTNEFENVEIFDLSKMTIAGDCRGCLKCGYANNCIYESKDDVIDTYRKLKKCDVIIFAGSIKDRYLSARWKTFIDRWFFTTHIPFFDKKVIGFIISGPLRQIPNLRTLLSDFFEAHGLTIGGFTSDESDDTSQQIRNLAGTLNSYFQSGYRPPRRFLGEYGHRVFRDEIFGGLKGVFVADHKYYKKNGLYNFPHKNLLKRLTTTIMYLAMKLPFVRKEIQTNMADYMFKPYERVVKSKLK